MSINKKYRDITRFFTPIRLVRITSLPIRVTNLVAQFQRVIRYILFNYIPYDCNCYLDNITVSRSETNYSGEELEPRLRRYIIEYIQRIDRILTNIKRSGCIVLAEKSEFYRSSIQIVGYVCTDGGRLLRAKVEKIFIQKVNINVKSIRRFLRIYVYFHIQI